MPIKYDLEKGKMHRHKKLRKQGRGSNSIEILVEILKKSDPDCRGTLKIRKLYASSPMEAAMADENMHDFLM
jgi:hypothetical protein